MGLLGKSSDSSLFCDNSNSSRILTLSQISAETTDKWSSLRSYNKFNSYIRIEYHIEVTSTYLGLNLFFVCLLSISILEWPMAFFIDLGSKVSCAAFCTDVLKKMLKSMVLWEIPILRFLVLWDTLNIFLIVYEFF